MLTYLNSPIGHRQGRRLIDELDVKAISIKTNFKPQMVDLLVDRETVRNRKMLDVDVGYVLTSEASFQGQVD